MVGLGASIAWPTRPSIKKNICRYLRALDATQFMSLCSKARTPINQLSAENLAGFANSFIPSRIRKGVKFTKCMISIGNTLQKAYKVISKYKYLLILFVLISWIKSAILDIYRGTAKKASKKAIQKYILI